MPSLSKFDQRGGPDKAVAREILWEIACISGRAQSRIKAINELAQHAGWHAPKLIEDVAKMRMIERLMALEDSALVAMMAARAQPGALPLDVVLADPDVADGDK